MTATGTVPRLVTYYEELMLMPVISYVGSVLKDRNQAQKPEGSEKTNIGKKREKSGRRESREETKGTTGGLGDDDWVDVKESTADEEWVKLNRKDC